MKSEYKITRSDNRSEYVLKFLYQDEWQELYRTWDIKHIAKWLSAHVDISTVPIRDGGPYRAFPIVESKSISMNLRDYLDSKVWTFQIARHYKNKDAEPEQCEYESVNRATQEVIGIEELVKARRKPLPKRDGNAWTRKMVYQDRVCWADGYILEFSEPPKERDKGEFWHDHIKPTNADQAFSRIGNSVMPLVPLGTVVGDVTYVILASLDHSRVRMVNAGYYAHFCRRYGDKIKFEVGDTMESPIAVLLNNEYMGLIMPVEGGNPKLSGTLAGRAAKKFAGTYDTLKWNHEQAMEADRRKREQTSHVNRYTQEPAYAAG